jgi:hypothetical protein
MNPYGIRFGFSVGKGDFKGIAAICFTVDHFADFFEYSFCSMVSCCPVVASSSAISGEIDVFGVV